MCNLYVFCGCPGSGKTTMSKNFSKKYNAVRYSFDEMKCGHYSDLFPHTIKSLQDKDDVVIDALFSTTKQRKDLLDAVNNIQCKKILVFMNTSLDESILRNAQRPHPLSSNFIRTVYMTLQRQQPTLDEGWDKIIVINNDEDIENLENNINNNIENNIKNIINLL